MLTITTPMGTVTHNRIDDAVELLRTSIDNGFPITITYAGHPAHGAFHGHPAGCSGECGV
jgi:hypothetical protein